MAEANEAPDDAARRELREELGLDVALHGLFVVDRVPPHGPWDEQLAFISDGATLDVGEAALLRPDHEEITELAFVSSDAALAGLGERLRSPHRSVLGSQTRGVPARLHGGRSWG